MPAADQLRLRLKVPMTVHEIYNRDKGRFSSRYCKHQFSRSNRRSWRQSLQQGFDGEVPRIRRHW